MAKTLHSLRKEDPKAGPGLTFLARQWQISDALPHYTFYMASSEVDQKFLGHFAKTTSDSNVYLSSTLFKVLGLSVILSEKLLRAHRNRRLDPTRDTKSVQLYHHILWLAREGLILVEQYVLPMVDSYVELKVLSYKLVASFYHIFVLFHNDPSVTKVAAGGPLGLFPEPLTPRNSKSNTTTANILDRTSILPSPPPPVLGGPVGGPPGLPAPRPRASSSAHFLLPQTDYTPYATQAFARASSLATRLLPGSHPIRLSVAVEYVAYVYSCLHERERSGQMAKKAIRDVYNAQEGMDDESFEDAAEMVRVLGKMMKRGLGSGSGSGSGGSRAGGGPGVGGSQESRSTPRRVTPPRITGSNGYPAAVPSPGMTNPI